MYAIVPRAGSTLFAGVLLFGVECVTPIASEDNWETTTPESVGIDSSKLSPLVARFEEWKEANLHGVVVVRHGKLVFEHYFRGFDLKARDGPAIIDFNAATTHDLRSMTKSVTALVLGAAIDDGIIADVDQSVLSFFPDYADLRTPEKDRITIRHLLTMSIGLAWSDRAPYTNENTLNASLDPYRYVLSLPVVEPAGLVWNYSSGATAVIGGILRRATETVSMCSPPHCCSIPWASPMLRGHGCRTETQRTGAAFGCGRATWRRLVSSCSIVAVGRKPVWCPRVGLTPPPHRRSRQPRAVTITVISSGLAPHRYLVGGSIGLSQQAKADNGFSSFRPLTSSQW